MYPFSTIILALPFATLEGVERARIPEGAAEKSKPFDPLFVLGVINSRAAKFYFDAMITDGLSVAPDQVRQIPIPYASEEAQKAVGLHVTNLLRLQKELREELRLAEFRHVVSTRARTGEDDLSHYMSRLGESSLSIGNRLDGVSKAREVSVTPELRGDDLVLRVKFVEGRPPKERTGEIICQFERSVNRFIALVLEDRDESGVGSGRLLSKIRAIAIPRFDPDWEAHLKIVREVVETVEQHEARASKLKIEIAAEARGIDSKVFLLYQLDKSDIATIESSESVSQGPDPSPDAIQSDSDQDSTD